MAGIETLISRYRSSEAERVRTQGTSVGVKLAQESFIEKLSAGFE